MAGAGARRSLGAMKVSMLLLASGRGERLGASIPKAFVEVAGEALVVRSLRRLASISGVDSEIVLAVDGRDREEFVTPLESVLGAAGVDVIVDGGATRQESMTRALAATRAESTVILVHDAARPFFPVAAAREVLERAAAVGGALLAIKVADTIKRVDDDGRVAATVDRSPLWAAQTPQAARRDVLEAALRRAEADGFVATDDVSLLEHAGVPVEVVLGSPRNFKITTPDDLALAEHFARTEASDTP